MTAPPISVVTTTYNYPSALELAIQTVLEQTATDFEYLVIGDGCTDETEDVVLAIDDPRIRWHNLPANLGNQADVNRIALEMAQGRLVAYLNHDDLWYPEHLASLRTCIDEGGFDVAASLALGISPPPHLHRELLGLPAAVGPEREFRVFSMTSSVMHTADAARSAGGWKRWRESTQVPTIEFFDRLRESTGNHAVVPRITSLKFHSADRRDSYRIKEASEQAYWYEQMHRDPDLRHRGLAAAMAFRTLRVPVPKLQQQPKPADAPPGWEIEQYRRLRGLEPNLDFGPITERPTVLPSDDYSQYGVIATGREEQFWITDPDSYRRRDDGRPDAIGSLGGSRS